ncbi:succinate-CoA ligase, beta subunit [Oesophagostomum dentatum]|uniref:Succinate-CoA ligase, beta subunit n=1 Tax=Oesophagostomum dentatum TaxID=61180 RepID=A0A0B1SUA2_OESDE|nr:succinate-CoA ligase, beta subunit [Oesophagostomum dentatum]
MYELGQKVAQQRFLNLHEYQSKELLNKHGCSVQNFIVASNKEEAQEKLKDLGGPSIFRLLSGLHLPVMVAEGVPIKRETYVAVLMDRESNGPLIVASPAGGVDIETEPIDIDIGITDEQAMKIAKNLEFSGEMAKKAANEIKLLYKVFISSDATQVEINPFVETRDGRVFCMDAKMNFDDSAAYRQKEIFAMGDQSEQDAREVEAHKYNLNYIGMDGNIACLVNGAGLAMATMDIIKLKGGDPANFLDVGGTVTEDQVFHAFRIITSDPKVGV